MEKTNNNSIKSVASIQIKNVSGSFNKIYTALILIIGVLIINPLLPLFIDDIDLLLILSISTGIFSILFMLIILNSIKDISKKFNQIADNFMKLDL